MAQRIVGLDIGTRAVRAVELTIGDGRPFIEACGQVGIPSGTVLGGEVRDRSTVVGALQRLWRKGDFSERRVHLGVAGLRAITREIDMPRVPPAELDNAVRLQADQVVPFALERTTLSSRVIAQFNDADGAPRLRVLVAAAHRDLVDGVVEAVQDAGLTPVSIDLNTAALARALYDPSGPGGPEAIVSVGAELTLVVVHERGVLQFVRTIDLGGETVTQAIASALDLPLVDAEGLKRRMGHEGAIDTRTKSAAAGVVNALVAEIHNSIRFFASLPGRGQVSRILVTGAGARTLGFLSHLQQGIEPPVTAAAPLSQVDTSRLPISAEDATAINPTLAVPVGLALPDPAGRPFNLLPAEVSAKVAERNLRRNLLFVGAGILAILIALSVWRVLKVNSKENSVAHLTQQNAYIRTVEIPKYSTKVPLQRSVHAEQLAIAPIVTGEIDWVLVLNQLGLALGPPYPNAAPVEAVPGQTANTVSAVMSGLGLSVSSAAPTSRPSTTQVASASTTVTFGALGDVTAWAENFPHSPILLNVTPSGTYTPSGTGGSVSFEVTMGINGLARNTQPNPLLAKVP